MWNTRLCINRISYVRESFFLQEREYEKIGKSKIAVCVCVCVECNVYQELQEPFLFFWLRKQKEHFLFMYVCLKHKISLSCYGKTFFSFILRESEAPCFSNFSFHHSVWFCFSSNDVVFYSCYCWIIPKII